MRLRESVRSGVGLTLAAISLGCAHGLAIVPPVQCPESSPELLSEQVEMVTTGDYPMTVIYLAQVEDVCCRNAAIAGRDTAWCDAPVEE
jgi:hypothetical protein